MAKIVFIGAGSWGFTRTIFKDLMTYENMDGATIALVDIHEERLRMGETACRKIAEEGGCNVTIEASTDRRDVLEGADAVLITILSGDTSVWQHDILVPKKYGVDICVGDTRGVAGIFRGLRTIPVMVDICRDIEARCPDALVLNYTNPMAILCHAMQRETEVNVTGLCHSVQGTAKMLATWAEVPFEELDYTCAGLNHLSWFLKLKHRGRDIYPVLRERVLGDRDIYNEEIVRNEMFLAFDYYVTESSGHNSEYSWWFRKRPELIERYCKDGTGWNPGEHAYILNEYRKREETWRDEFDKWLTSADWDDPEKKSAMLRKSNEYASSIINAYVGGSPFQFNGNVKNTHLISNLPEHCCVEVPVLTTRRTLSPLHVGELPQSVLPLTSLTALTEQMTVEASFTGDEKLVYQAVAQSPLTAACLSLNEARDMVNELFQINKQYLPQFKRHGV
ncbi:MAG: alpha-glucosidase/alpha-galactosidase [Candidatus Pacebacteria bacterium]|nr:alpha-glucosidase/alpha-galactosidase [Candidatus Paceibacterota bacterium]